MDLTHDEMAHRANDGCEPFWDEADEDTDHTVAFAGTSGRITARITWVRGQIVDYAVMLDVWVDGAWRKHARVDTDHKCVHAHRFRRDGSQIGHREWIRDLAPCDQGHPAQVGASFADSWQSMVTLAEGFDEQSWK